MTIQTREASRAISTRSRFADLQSRFHERLDVPPWVLLVEVFIGVGWLRAAIEKMVDPSWWNGTVLRSFLDAQAGITLPWYQPFVDSVIEPNMLAVSVAVVLAQFFVGVALIAGWKVMVGLTAGVFLNLNFVAAGAVNPSLFYLICQMALLLWLFHGEKSVRKRQLRLLASAASVLVLVNMPFISTLDPAAVVEDPAITLVTVGLLTAVAARLGARGTAGSIETELL